MYLADAPPAERRAQALSIDVEQLREILGEASLRELLSPEVLQEQERILQRLTYPLKNADAVHDSLLALGDLRVDELAARVPAGAAWLAELEAAGRVLRVRVAGEERVAAVEDAARLRDALGARLPDGIAPAFLEPVATPLRDLLARYARTHGPFKREDAAARLGLPPARLTAVLGELLAEGRLAEGEFRPGGSGSEYCDAEVLRGLRARSLTRLRKQIEPVDGSCFARFLLDWQGINQRRLGRDGLLDAVTQLRGCALPASALENEILPARVVGYRPADLDALCASGQVLWLGVEPLGQVEGRIMLLRPDDDALLSLPVTPVPGELAGRVREALGRRGAIFSHDLEREVRGFSHDLEETLWAMVWAGEIMNDTLEPLRRRLVSLVIPPARFANGRGNAGRWSLRPRPSRAINDTEARTELARALLDRYGIVMRETAHAEAVPGGFSTIYDDVSAGRTWPHSPRLLHRWPRRSAIRPARCRRTPAPADSRRDGRPARGAVGCGSRQPLRRPAGVAGQPRRIRSPPPTRVRCHRDSVARLAHRPFARPRLTYLSARRTARGFCPCPGGRPC